MDKKLIIIDGNGLGYRSYYGMIHTNLVNSKGFATGATFAFLNSIISLLVKFPSTHVVCAFDSRGATIRHKLYPDYKANRKAKDKPQELFESLTQMAEAVDQFWIPSVAVDTFEGDDIIATVATKAVEDGFSKVLIVGADKDFAQLVNEHVFLYRFNTKSDAWEINGNKDIKSRFGVFPDQMKSYQAIVGDSSDNIPGIKGLGKKAAATLLHQFGSLQGIYKNLDKISGAAHGKLVAEKENAKLWYQLVSLHTKVPIEWDWEDLEIVIPRGVVFMEYLEEMSFDSLADKVTHLHQKYGTSIDDLEQEL